MDERLHPICYLGFVPTHYMVDSFTHTNKQYRIEYVGAESVWSPVCSCPSGTFRGWCRHLDLFLQEVSIDERLAMRRIAMKKAAPVTPEFTPFPPHPVIEEMDRRIDVAQEEVERLRTQRLAIMRALAVLVEAGIEVNLT